MGGGGGLQDHVCNCEGEQSVIMVTIDEGGWGYVIRFVTILKRDGMRLGHHILCDDP